MQNESFLRAKDDIDLAVDPPPDLAIEIDISTSSMDKLGIYAGLGIPEVWTHDEGGIVAHVLDASGTHRRTEKSAAFPNLPLKELNRFLAERNTVDETSLLRAFRDWVRTSFPEG